MLEPAAERPKYSSKEKKRDTPACRQARKFFYVFMELGNLSHLIANSNTMSSLSLSIPTPCDQKWSDFTPAEGGGHCALCNKIVVDFTKMTDDEIVSYFKKNTGKTCGQFNSTQLKTYTTSNNYKFLKPWSISVAFAGLMLLLARPLKAQNIGEPKMEHVAPDRDTRLVGDTTYNGTFVVYGRVKFDTTAMPGVNILRKNTTTGTVSDIDGNFTIVISDPREVEELVFSFIGMKTQTVSVLPNENYFEINLEYDLVQLDNVTVVAGGVRAQSHLVGILGAVESRPNFFQRIWNSVRHVFHR